MNNTDLVKTTLEEILNFIDVNPSIYVAEEDENINVTIEGHDLSFLIGYRGESLSALQTLLSLILFKKLSNWIHITVDINNYRRERQVKLEEIVRNSIDRVRFLDKEVEMPPMPSFERRQVHIFVSGYDDVESESAGEGRDRRVILRPSKRK